MAQRSRSPAVIAAVGLLLGAASACAQLDPDPGSYFTCDQSAVLFHAFSRDDPEITAQHRADSDLAVAACHLVTVSNFGIKGFSKGGVAGSLSHRLSLQPINSTQDSFWLPLVPPEPPPLVSRSGDPRVIYDAQTGRFFAVALLWEHVGGPPPTFDRFYLALAVSKGSDPNPAGGDPGWWFYRLNVTEALPNPPPTIGHIDNPSIAVDSGKVYVVVNAQFPSWNLAVIDKAWLLDGTAGAATQGVLLPPADFSFTKVDDTWAKPALRFGPDDGQAQYIAMTACRLWGVVPGTRFAYTPGGGTPRSRR